VPSLFGGGGQTSEQKKLTTVQTQAAQTGLAAGQKTLPQGTDALQGPLNFFQALLSGDRNTIMSALNPEVSSLTAQYDTGRQTAESFAPRGGGRAAALESLPFQEAGTIENLVQGARATGASGVEQIGSFLAQLGLGELGTGSNIAGSAFNNIQTAKENQQQQQAGAGSAVGSLIGLLVGA
jgi:hypothetical protein